MNHIENLTRYVANFVDELAKSGVQHVVISPGSRSTPLAMLVSEHPKLKEWILVDERSAAFFALGIAKETNRPVALICTSGTAAANYFPAIIEAKHSRVPLIVLTADRPHELRHVGASQTIDQINMYGHFVKHFEEMALPEKSEEMIFYVRSRASRAVHIASSGNEGPVHLNFPFREPLIPNLELNGLWSKSIEPYHISYEGEKVLSTEQLKTFFSKVKNEKRGLIVCGPQPDKKLAEQLVKLATEWNIPIIADPLSQIRSCHDEKSVIIDSYDAFLKSKSVRSQLKPDYIIRFGAMPVSKSYLFFLEEHKNVLKFVVENDSEAREPTNFTTELLFTKGVLFCEKMCGLSHEKLVGDDWLRQWQRKNDIAKNIVTTITSETLTEGETVRYVLQVIPKASRLFIGNSMAVRDLDTFFTVTEKRIYVHANRGVSGIDGIVSTALGVAAATDQHVTLIIGDLAFYHDLNGLLVATQYNLNMTIILINNDGGGIFSFLPQANEKKHFEKLFGTPLQIDFKHSVKMYKGKYFLAENKKQFISHLKRGYETKGLHVIEVQTNREQNVKWHRQLWHEIEEELLNDNE